ncbi:unnamed protein product [Durusdinium trenchii]|uniref:Uncharacterized protein n=1 Tax=Durusdinium trenchii TaxID=1381693 RepID=A0ABP0L4D4_9DINO
MSRAPSQAGSRAPSAAGRRSSSVAPKGSPLPSRKSSSALEEHSNTAVTRAIYHHAREFLKKSREGREELPGAQRAQQAVQAMVQGTRAVILESTVVQIIIRCVERTKQLQAKRAEEKWKASERFLFASHVGLDSARRISQALGDMLLGFEGNDDVRARFLNVAKTFDESEVSLRQLQQSFGDNLDGLQETRNNFDRCTEEVIRLVSLLEGDCASMRVQLRRTLKSPSMSHSMAGCMEKLGQKRLLMHSLPQNSSDHIGELLDTLEHDLCDSPLTAMVQVAQDVNDQIVKQLSESGRLEKLRPSRLSLQEEKLQVTSPAKLVEEMFETLRPCIFEAVPGGSRRPSKCGDISAAGGLHAQNGVEGDESGLANPSSPNGPVVDLSFACAQLERLSAEAAPPQRSSGGPALPRASSGAPPRLPTSEPATAATSTARDERGERGVPRGRAPKGASEMERMLSVSPDGLAVPGMVPSDPPLPAAGLAHVPSAPPGAASSSVGPGAAASPAPSSSGAPGAHGAQGEGPRGSLAARENKGDGSHSGRSHRSEPLSGRKPHSGRSSERPRDGATVGVNDRDASHARSGATSGNAPPVRPLAGAEGASRSRESPARGEAVEREDRRLGTHPLQKQQSQIDALDSYEAEEHGHQHPRPSHSGHSRQSGHGEGRHGEKPTEKLPMVALAKQNHSADDLLNLRGETGGITGDGRSSSHAMSKHEDSISSGPPASHAAMGPGADALVPQMVGEGLGLPRRTRLRKSSEPENKVDYSRFMAPAERGYEQQMSISPFSSPLLVSKSKLEERPAHIPARRLTITALEPLRPGLPLPVAYGLQSRADRSSSSQGSLRSGRRPSSLDRGRLGGNAVLPTLQQVDARALVQPAPLHQRKSSPARSNGSDELLR